MKLLKKIAVLLVMATSMSVSSVAFAAPNGAAAIQAAGELTASSLQEAKSLLEKGGESEQVQKALNEARQAVKEYRYEPTERTRQKLNDKIKAARDSFLKNDNTKSLENIDAALALHAEIKKIYDANH